MAVATGGLRRASITGFAPARRCWNRARPDDKLCQARKKLVFSPRSRLGAPSTRFVAGSVVGPRAPTPIDSLKFKFEEDKLFTIRSGKGG